MKKVNLCVIGLLSMLCLFGCSNIQPNYDNTTFTETDDLNAVMELIMMDYDKGLDKSGDVYYDISDYNYQYDKDKEIIEVNIKISHYDDNTELLKSGTINYLFMTIDHNYTIYESFNHPLMIINVYDQNGYFILTGEFQFNK